MVQDGGGPEVAQVLHVIPFALGFGGSGDHLIWIYYVLLWFCLSLLFKWLFNLLALRHHSPRSD
jgi:hypothetical protein